MLARKPILLCHLAAPATGELDVPETGLSLAWTVQGCIEAAGCQAYIPQAPPAQHYNMSCAYSVQHG